MAAKKTGDVLLAAAMALKPKEVSRLAFDPIGAKAACRDGLTALKKFRSELQKNYKGFELDAFDELLALCDRTREQQRIVQKTTTTGTLAQLLPAVFAWRRKLLPLAQSLAESGEISIREVNAISKGSGNADQLSDVADLVALLTPLKAKVESMVGAGALSQALAASSAANEALGAGRAPTEAASDAAELRDRYATLIVLRHDRLRAAVAAVVGYREAEARVPPLADRTRTKTIAPPSPA